MRAGLHVENVDFKDNGTLKLMDRENAYWRRVTDTLEDHIDSDRATCNRLRILRRQVLNGELRNEDSWGLPHAVAGTAAGIALFLGAAMWWDTMWTQPAPATRTASIEWDSTWTQSTSGTRAVSVESMGVDNVEFANNIDFYTWLEKQSDTIADSGG